MAGPPKPLSLPGEPASSGSTPSAHVPRPLTLPTASPAAPSAPARSPPPPALSGLARGPQPPPAVHHGPHTLALGGQASHPEDDAAVAKFVAESPELARLAVRLRARLQSLRGAQERDLMCWGEENVAVCGEFSKVYAQTSQRISQLKVDEWVRKCQEASTDTGGGLLGMFRTKESPDTYENRFRALQAEMGPLLLKLTKMTEELKGEVEDLTLDAVSLSAVAPRYTDATLSMIISNRHRILTASLQTTASLIIGAESMKQTLAQNCQVLDQLMAVTIPAWRLAAS